MEHVVFFENGRWMEINGRLEPFPTRQQMQKYCPMRHPDNGNCLPAGGFCRPDTEVCRALHCAYGCGKDDELTQLKNDGRLVVLPCNDPLTLDELREMVGEPVWVVFTPDADGERLSMWVLVSVEGDEIFLQSGLGGRSAYKDVAADIEAIYRRKPEEGDSNGY